MRAESWIPVFTGMTGKLNCTRDFSNTLYESTRPGYRTAGVPPALFPEARIAYVGVIDSSRPSRRNQQHGRRAQPRTGEAPRPRR